MLCEFLGGIENREAAEYKYVEESFEYSYKILQTVDPEYTPPQTTRKKMKGCAQFLDAH